MESWQLSHTCRRTWHIDLGLIRLTLNRRIKKLSAQRFARVSHLISSEDSLRTTFLGVKTCTRGAKWLKQVRSYCTSQKCTCSLQKIICLTVKRRSTKVTSSWYWSPLCKVVQNRYRMTSWRPSFSWWKQVTATMSTCASSIFSTMDWLSLSLLRMLSKEKCTEWPNATLEVVSLYFLAISRSCLRYTMRFWATLRKSALKLLLCSWWIKVSQTSSGIS